MARPVAGTTGGGGAGAGVGAGAGAGAGPGFGSGLTTTGGSNSSSKVLGRRRHHSNANRAARAAVPPAIHGQYQPAAGAVPSTSCGGGRVMLGVAEGSGSCAAGSTGCTPGVAEAAGAGAGTRPGLVAAGWGRAVWTGRGAGRPVAAPPGCGTGWLVTGAGAGAGAGAGLGRGAGARTTGLSSSTGPAARGLLDGREVGIVNTGASCAAAGAGTSGSSSANAPAILALPPTAFIIMSIISATGPIGLSALNRK